jgi:hypothetical protein
VPDVGVATAAATVAVVETSAGAGNAVPDDGGNYRSVIRPGTRVLGGGGGGFGLGDKSSYELKLQAIRDKLTNMGEQIGANIALKYGGSGVTTPSKTVQDTVEEEIVSKPNTPISLAMAGLGLLPDRPSTSSSMLDEEIPEDIEEKPRTP